jgi:hypothetical protein
MSPGPADIAHMDLDDFDDPLISLLPLARERCHARETASHNFSGPLSVPRGGSLDEEEFALLDKWNTSNIERILCCQVSNSSGGIHDCKQDVGPGLDAVQAGIIAEQWVPTLFDA